jgi:hypothetical protein
MITGYSSEVAIAQMIIQSELGLEILNIGALNSAPELSDAEKWPNYNRVSVSDIFPSTYTIWWFVKLDWRYVNLIHD